VIGILGGVASGKSLIAGQLESLGARILDGDRAGHRVLGQQEVKSAIRARWGDAVFRPDGEANRRVIAQIVFDPSPTGKSELEFLEQLTHPRIKRLLQEQIRQLAADGAGVAVLDAPVMLKAGWDALCYRIVFVEAPRELRLRRALRRGWSEEDFARREAAQEPVEQKRARADVVIDNRGSRAATWYQVQEFWRSIRPTR